MFIVKDDMIPDRITRFFHQEISYTNSVDSRSVQRMLFCECEKLSFLVDYLDILEFSLLWF